MAKPVQGLAGLALAAGLLAACATAGPPATAPPAAAAPSIADAAIDAQSGAYQLDPTHARVTWRVMHLGLSGYVGRFETIAGRLELNAAQPSQSTVAIEIDARSLTTGHQDKPGAERFDEKLARDVLGADQAPKITFTSTRVERTGEKTGRVIGTLSFNGRAREVVLETTLNDARLVLVTGKHTAGFSARTVINRSEWGADDWSAFVGDAVEIEIEAEFQKM